MTSGGLSSALMLMSMAVGLRNSSGFSPAGREAREFVTIARVRHYRGGAARAPNQQKPPLERDLAEDHRDQRLALDRGNPGKASMNRQWIGQTVATLVSGAEIFSIPAALELS